MKLRLFLLALSLVLSGFQGNGQQDVSAQNRVQPNKPIPGNCEDNILNLSNAHRAAGTDGTIIAIARLGTGEQSREINNRRLHNVRVYLTEYGWHRDPATVIIAEGKRARGYGQVELYVRGILFATLATRRNQDLLVGSCEPDDIRPVKAERNLYPYLDQKPRKPMKR
ncbi:MAG TPA: hypothetical protein VJT71_13105 [Pyrinomonadaceae bacterium]|nr:hypothetical protein [Pyrinomonadaceae bacterium]